VFAEGAWLAGVQCPVMPKPKRLDILLDEDVASGFLIEYLTYRGYSVVTVRKGEPDHLVRGSLIRHRLFFSKDKDWLKPGRVPRKHGGIVVLDAGHADEIELTSLVDSFLRAYEKDRQLAAALVDRRFLYSWDEVWEYDTDGNSTRIFPRM